MKSIFSKKTKALSIPWALIRISSSCSKQTSFCYLFEQKSLSLSLTYYRIFMNITKIIRYIIISYIIWSWQVHKCLPYDLNIFISPSETEILSWTTKTTVSLMQTSCLIYSYIWMNVSKERKYFFIRQLKFRLFFIYQIDREMKLMIMSSNLKRTNRKFENFKV